MITVARRLPRPWMEVSRILVLPLLRGCGQMLFQPSVLTGGAFLLLILSQSVSAAGMCLAGVLGSTLCAFRLEHPCRSYYEGLGGFNGGLLGLALSVFYEPSGLLLLTAVAGGVLTGVVRVLLVRALPVPPFTAPFIIVAWLAFGVLELAALDTVVPPVLDGWRIYAPATNASQVLFLFHPWVGVLVIAAVWLHSRRAALWVGGASVVGWLTTLLFNMPAELAAAGLLGYNGLILAAALKHRDTHILLVMAGVVLSVWLSRLFFEAGITPLSAPFVLSAWVVIAAEAAWAARPWRA